MKKCHKCKASLKDEAKIKCKDCSKTFCQKCTLEDVGGRHDYETRCIACWNHLEKGCGK